jgi:GDP-4-dehydro-6-deoxy-D-mannose reductase
LTAHALVTGATGFAGGHLLDELLRSGHFVHAWSNPRGRSPNRALTNVEWHTVDLLDRDAVLRSLDAIRPLSLYHLGGVADVHGSWRTPATALRVNVLGTHHLLEAVIRLRLPCRILIAGSALVYRPSSQPLTEDAPVSPTTPYGVSKLAQEMLAERVASAVLLARAFNHAGPRQDASYVTSAFARQLAEIETGRREPTLRVGNLESRRDITDVRDTVRAYRAILERGTPHRPYNVCSGRAYRIGDLLDILLSLARTRVRVETDPDRLRPNDTAVVLGSGARITRETGWQPLIPIEQTLGDLLDYWRSALPFANSRPA